MAIPEACGLWIEQRIQEELEQQGETGASLRAIGRQVAAEVEKYFETKVSPDTIRKRAERQGGTNVPKSGRLTASSVSEEIKQIKHPAKDGTMRGGPRIGAGRKIKSTDEQQDKKEEVFREKYNAFLKEVKKAHSTGWKYVPYSVACDLIGNLNNYV